MNAKNVRNYIDDENIPTSWGGRDNYAYSFKPEYRQSDEGVIVSDTLHKQMSANNNNNAEQANLNLLNRKVSLPVKFIPNSYKPIWNAFMTIRVRSVRQLFVGVSLLPN